MNDIVISVENLAKKYVLAHQAQKGDGLRHGIEKALRAPLQWLQGRRERRIETQEEFWALRDVSMQIRKGEVVGIIGRNGAGKSTLLKILSRITEPVSGRVRIRGRVASLLEVGTGFHPELTGRENIFLNGAILGMARTEIKKKFDEIVSFAGIEKFLDTPVKRYSSGMYVRLAFAVAAHLEPEILIVDEVLAVGDAEFQKKCLDKMDNVSHAGRTVLFVSHNMPAVTRLCSRAVLLEDGRVKSEGPASAVTAEYLNFGMNGASLHEWPDLAKAPGNSVVRLCAVRVLDEEGKLVTLHDIRRPVAVEFEYEVLKGGYVFHPHFGVRNEQGLILFSAQDVDPNWRRRRRPPGRYVSRAWIPGNLLPEGALSVTITLMTLDPPGLHVDMHDLAFFRVVDCMTALDTARGDYPHPIPGVMRPLLKWTTEYTPRQDANIPELVT
jgi:lipopolysaccharide transport system ATP-binding protein